MPAPKYSITTKGDFVKIYIDRILHLSIKYKEVVAVQSWRDGTNWYCIEFYTKTGKVLCEYDTIEKWKAIIELINQTF